MGCGFFLQILHIEFNLSVSYWFDMKCVYMYMQLLYLVNVLIFILDYTNNGISISSKSRQLPDAVLFLIRPMYM